MRLIDPQPMETLPEEGEVFVELQYRVTGERFIFGEDDEGYGKPMEAKYAKEEHWADWVKPIAWSYTATTNPNEKEPT